MELAAFSVELLLLLFVVAVVAGFLDTLAGGGGLITLPALILAGVPPLAALGTNKLQAAMGTATATTVMLKTGRVRWHNIKPLMLTAFAGSVVGAVVVQFINTDILSLVIPIVLLCIVGYFIAAPAKSMQPGPARLSEQRYKNSVVPLIGYYDGMFGPATGSFFALAGVSCRGQDLISATTVAKPLNFATNVASLVVYLLAGQIVWLAGLLMMLGQVIGAWLGSHCLLRINPAYLRMIVVLMSTSMLLKYVHSMGWFSLG